jgi:hypothetical protein
VFTQLALVMLLWGTMCGGLALISDVGVILIDRLAAGQSGWDVPGWVNGRTCMTVVALLVLFPLCLQRHMREVSGTCSAHCSAGRAEPLVTCWLSICLAPCLHHEAQCLSKASNLQCLLSCILPADCTLRCPAPSWCVSCSWKLLPQQVLCLCWA